jgi:putative resolvase
VNVSAWADRVGVGRYTVYRWYHAGTWPVPARRAGRLILAWPVGAPAEPGRTVVCAGVSSAGRRPDLDRQVGKLSAWVTANGLTVGEAVTGIESAMNGRCRELGRLLAGAASVRIAIGRQGRMARLGAGHLQAAVAARGRQIMILDQGEVDLVRDMTGVLTWFCGRRGAGNRAVRAVGRGQAQTPGA